MKHLFLSSKFFLLYSAVIVLFMLSFPFYFLFPVAQTALVIALAITLVELMMIYGKQINVTCKRTFPKVLSLGDKNPIRLLITNNSNYKLEATIIDELPNQLQRRDFSVETTLEKQDEKEIKYDVTPIERGEYHFGNVNIFISTFLGLIQRRLQLEKETMVPVYPSIIQMKNFSLKAFDQTSHLQGIKKIRRIGQSYEFEQIKNYVQGDDFRSINWKASSKRNSLMVNQFQDERSQQVYCLLDKSRVMRMPFNGMSLMDYAINSCLVIANVTLQKHDKAGLISFSDKIGTTLKAERSQNQLNKILLSLYNEKERKKEANYEILYHASRKLIKGRSLIFLFTNFESVYGMERVLPILRRINNLHLLVVIFFKNTEVEDFSKGDATSTQEIYHKTIAQQFIYEKQQMVQILRQYGIQTILTSPEDLSMNTVNKYLELKSRGLI